MLLLQLAVSLSRHCCSNQHRTAAEASPNPCRLRVSDDCVTTVSDTCLFKLHCFNQELPKCLSWCSPGRSCSCKSEEGVWFSESGQNPEDTAGRQKSRISAEVMERVKAWRLRRRGSEGRTSSVSTAAFKRPFQRVLVFPRSWLDWGCTHYPANTELWKIPKLCRGRCCN